MNVYMLKQIVPMQLALKYLSFEYNNAILKKSRKVGLSLTTIFFEKMPFFAVFLEKKIVVRVRPT